MEGPKGDEVETKAKILAATLNEKLDMKPKFRGQIELLGRAPSPIHKLRNRDRWQLLLKGKQIAPLLELAKRAGQLVPRYRNVRLHIAVGAYALLWNVVGYDDIGDLKIA